MHRKEGNRREIWVNEKGKWRGGEHYEVDKKGSRVYKKQRQQRKKNKRKRFINNDKVQNLNQIKLRWEN